MEKKLFKSTSLVAILTMFSRVLGFVRDVILAEIFGAGGAFDAFVIAFKIPNFMRRLFADGAFSQAFVPILAEFRANRTPQELKQFVSRVAGTLGVTVLCVVALVEVIAPLVIIVFAPGFFIDDPMRYQLATHLLRIMFPYLLLISSVALCGAILNTFGRFGVPAFTPVLLNVSLIGVSVLWAEHVATPIYVLGFGVLIGGVTQLAIQLPFLKKLQLLPWPKLGWRDPGVMRVMKLMVPALFGVSVAQISLLIDNFFASFLPVGSIAWLYYSDRLTYLPLGVIGVALATVVLPHLSRAHAKETHNTYSATIDWALRCVVVIGVPSAIALFVLAGPLLVTLFHHGAFNDYDVLMTRESLLAFSVGLPGFMLVKILASAFYSKQNIKTPVKVAAVAVAINLIFNLILIKPLAHAGLALATSISSLFNAFCLLWILLRDKIYQPQPGWLWLTLRIVVANVVMAAVIYWVAGSLQQWFNWPLALRCWHLLEVIILGVLTYFIVLWVVGARLKHFRAPM